MNVSFLVFVTLFWVMGKIFVNNFNGFGMFSVGF